MSWKKVLSPLLALAWIASAPAAPKLAAESPAKLAQIQVELFRWEGDESLIQRVRLTKLPLKLRPNAWFRLSEESPQGNPEARLVPARLLAEFSKDSQGGVQVRLHTPGEESRLVPVPVDQGFLRVDPAGPVHVNSHQDPDDPRRFPRPGTYELRVQSRVNRGPVLALAPEPKDSGTL